MVSQLSTHNHFNSFPTEIQCKIFSYLDEESAYQASQVCHLWNQICLISVKVEQQFNLKRWITCVVKQLDKKKHSKEIQKLNRLCVNYFPDCWKNTQTLLAIKAQLTHFQHMIIKELRPVQTRDKIQIFNKLSNELSSGKEMPKYFTTPEKVLEDLNSVPILENIESSTIPETTLEVIQQIMSHCDTIVLFAGPKNAAKIIPQKRSSFDFIERYYDENINDPPVLHVNNFFKTTILSIYSRPALNFLPFMCAHLLINKGIEKEELKLFAENAGIFREAFAVSLVIQYVRLDRFDDALEWLTFDHMSVFNHELDRLDESKIFTLFEKMIQKKMDSLILDYIRQKILEYNGLSRYNNRLSSNYNERIGIFLSSINQLIIQYPNFEKTYIEEIKKAFNLKSKEILRDKGAGFFVIKIVECLKTTAFRDELICWFVLNNKLENPSDNSQSDSIFAFIQLHSDKIKQIELFNHVLNNPFNFINLVDLREYNPTVNLQYNFSNIFLNWLKENVSFRDFWLICCKVSIKTMILCETTINEREGFVGAINHFSLSSAAEIIQGIKETPYLSNFIAIKLIRNLHLIHDKEIQRLLSHRLLQ